MAASETAQMKTCPNCGAEVPVYRDFVTWCEKCNWGLEGDQKEAKKKNRFEKLYEDLGKQQSKAIFEQLQQDKSLRPTWSRTRILIFILAGLVHLVSLGLFTAGLVLLITQRENFIFVLLALLLLGLAWILRPRPAPQPKENVLSREEYPALYGLVDQVAKSLGTHIDQIVIDEDYNASFSKTGWKQKRTLTIGLPLWEVLTHQERVALIGHEMAHDVNGDASRGFFVGSAVHALIQWYIVLMPDRVVDSQNGLVGLLMAPFRMLGVGATAIVWALIRLMTILTYRDSQRAEYLADRLGAATGGCDAYISSMRKLLYGETFWLAVQHCALNSQKNDVYKELDHLIANTPPSEMERIKRLEERNLTRLDVTHPPTALRIQMVQEQQTQAPSIMAEPETMRAIEQQLAGYRKKIQTHLFDRYRAAIYS